MEVSSLHLQVYRHLRPVLHCTVRRIVQLRYTPASYVQAMSEKQAMSHYKLEMSESMICESVDVARLCGRLIKKYVDILTPI
jgi:hypothetical protein